MLHNCFPFTPIIMKRHTKTPHEARMNPWILWSKGQRSQCIDYFKWLMLHNCFPFTHIIMKFHTTTSDDSRMLPMDFQVKRSKVKVTMH